VPAATEPMRVLFAYRDDVDVDGGAATVMKQTAAALGEVGVEVDITYEVCPDPRGYDVVHAWNVWLPGTALKQLEHLREQGAVVVWQPFYLDLGEHTWANRAIPAVLGGQATEERRAELVRALAAGVVKVGDMTQRTVNEPVAGFHATVKRMLELVDHVCVCSTHEIQQLAQMARAPELRFTVARHGVDADAFAGARPEPFLERFGVEDAILCVGAVEGRKNQLMLCEALRGTGLPIVLVGPCYEPWYLDLCKQRGDNVLHTGRVPREMVASALKAAALHVLPSFTEGSALASLEAAAAGCPVVVSNRSSEFEYYGDLARFCDPVDVESIRDTVLHAYEESHDPQWRSALSEHVRGYTWADAATRSVEAYHRAKARRAGAERKACGLETARGRVLLAFADELVSEPSLLDTYAAAYGADDDVTLAIRTGGLDGDTERALMQAAAAAGLEGPGAPDLLALPALTPEQEGILARQAEGALTRRAPAAPFDAVAPLHVG